MTDNSDLLGADAPAAVEPAKKARGRPRKPVVVAPVVVVSADPATPNGDAEVTTIAALETNGDLTILDEEVLPGTTLGELVPAGTTLDATVVPGTTLGELVPAGTTLDAIKSIPNDDGSTSVELAPVSTEYAAAMEQRVRIIGQPKREYAYQRLQRAGKKL